MFPIVKNYLPSPLETVSQWDRGVRKRTKQPGSKALECALFEVMGYCRCHRKANSFKVLSLPSSIVKRLRSKAFSPVCLFRFYLLPLSSVTTQSLKGEGLDLKHRLYRFRLMNFGASLY
jgi:hypothetical protein